MMWFNKKNPLAFYVDQRQVNTTLCDDRPFEVNPDMIMDFRDLSFPENTFKMVVFDPPHLVDLGSTSWLAIKYGTLLPTWEQDIKQGFKECIRVLEPNGILIFKWNEIQITIHKLLSILDQEPLFGHTSGKHGRTKWLTFMKTPINL